MKIVIKVFGRLLDYLPRQFEVEFEKQLSVHQLISTCIKKSASSVKKMFYDPKMSILINGRNILTLSGFDTTLNDGDIVSFMPFVVGG
jgi:molybdopterin converting factor small subunit